MLYLAGKNILHLQCSQHAADSMFSSSEDQLKVLTGKIQNSFPENVKRMMEKRTQLFSWIFLEQFRDVFRTFSNM